VEATSDVGEVNGLHESFIIGLDQIDSIPSRDAGPLTMVYNENPCSVLEGGTLMLRRHTSPISQFTVALSGAIMGADKDVRTRSKRIFGISQVIKSSGIGAAL
jgi:hypothetical protein